MRKQLVGALVAGGLLLSGGWALAATPGERPKFDDDPASTSEVDDPTTTTVATTAPAPEPEPEDSEESGGSEDTGAAEHPDNHGADVSQAAHECPRGQEAKEQGTNHGECVREVARKKGDK